MLLVELLLLMENSFFVIAVGPYARKTQDYLPLFAEDAQLRFRNRQTGYYLLLIMVCVRTIVTGAHGSCVLGGSARRISEVVPDESFAVADATRARRVALRIPSVLRQTNVVANRL